VIRSNGTNADQQSINRNHERPRLISGAVSFSNNTGKQPPRQNELKEIAQTVAPMRSSRGQFWKPE